MTLDQWLSEYGGIVDVATRTKSRVELPAMYQKQKSGAPYDHNNCIGCPKGQMGYQNKIRVDFPDVFQKMSDMEQEIGAAINKTYKKIDGKRLRSTYENHYWGQRAGSS